MSGISAMALRSKTVQILKQPTGTQLGDPVFKLMEDTKPQWMLRTEGRSQQSTETNYVVSIDPGVENMGLVTIPFRYDADIDKSFLIHFQPEDVKYVTGSLQRPGKGRDAFRAHPELFSGAISRFLLENVFPVVPVESPVYFIVESQYVNPHGTFAVGLELTAIQHGLACAMICHYPHIRVCHAYPRKVNAEMGIVGKKSENPKFKLEWLKANTPFQGEEKSPHSADAMIQALWFLTREKHCEISSWQSLKPKDETLSNGQIDTAATNDENPGEGKEEEEPRLRTRRGRKRNSQRTAGTGGEGSFQVSQGTGFLTASASSQGK